MERCDPDIDRLSLSAARKHAFGKIFVCGDYLCRRGIDFRLYVPPIPPIDEMKFELRNYPLVIPTDPQMKSVTASRRDPAVAGEESLNHGI